jgi:hypothetical protein
MDELDFKERKKKFKALDHYALVLILDMAFNNWSYSTEEDALAEV